MESCFRTPWRWSAGSCPRRTTTSTIQTLRRSTATAADLQIGEPGGKKVQTSFQLDSVKAFLPRDGTLTGLSLTSKT